MTLWLAAVVAAATAVAGGVAATALARRRGSSGLQTPPCERILLPFTGPGVSRRVLDAALRLAIAEHATLMPTYLARVPRELPLDAPLPRQSGVALPILEAIDQAATHEGVPVDSRVARGRTFRHALQQVLDEEPVDRVVVPASDDPHTGLSGGDLVWLLERAPAEVLILRPRPQERERLSAESVAGHF
jgi:hypothetical protein